MKMIQLNLETVTPMFLHGANTNKIELRPPPFKALFRYWWRTVQDCEANSLRDKEAKLFGSTKCKAPFSIRISGTTELNEKKYKPLPHRTDNRGFKRDSYNAGQSFNLYLITKDESATSTYKQIAKLGFLLGGVGNRSRRGFGSVREKSWNFTDVSDLRNEVLATLNGVTGVDRFRINGPTIESTLHRFPQYPVIRCIYFGEPTGDVDSLLKKIGQATHNHKDDALGYAKGRQRLASPIHVRIQRVKSEYIPVVTQLPFRQHLAQTPAESEYIPVVTQLHSRDLGPKQDKFIDAIIT